MRGILYIDKKRIKKELKTKIQLFADKLNKQGIKIDQLLLFGSYTKGQAKPYSDIDLCVVSSKFGKDLIQEAADLRLISNTIDWRIEPHPFNPSNLKVIEDPFIYQIKTTGIKII